MPKGSKELTNARKEEIIDACASLYETIGFQDVTIQGIGAKTSFTRTSIYNYFHTKEEIFLALLQREYEAWNTDLLGLLKKNPSLSPDEFADRLGRVLEKRGCLLKLLSMNLYDMECNSRVENLAAFKRAYGAVMQTLSRCLETYFPPVPRAGIQEFLYAFFPFLFGVYPYTAVTAKQKEAMGLAHVEYVRYSVYEIVKLFVTKLLQGFRTSDRAIPQAGRTEGPTNPPV